MFSACFATVAVMGWW